jgi:hypothetical protein
MHAYVLQRAASKRAVAYIRAATEHSAAGMRTYRIAALLEASSIYRRRLIFITYREAGIPDPGEVQAAIKLDDRNLQRAIKPPQQHAHCYCFNQRALRWCNMPRKL